VTVPGRSSTPAVLERVQAAFTAGLPWSPAIVVRSGPELASIIAANPWPEAVEEPKFLNVAFCSAQPDRRADLDRAAWAPDE
jgi:uncharacterized protein (DUF1697 family)